MTTSTKKVFVDTNVLLYLLSSDARKAKKAEQVVALRPTVSVQVLNEISNVCLKKLSMTTAEVAEFVHVVKRNCTVEPLTSTHSELALSLHDRWKISYYDSLIVAAALISDCPVLLTEDLQPGMRFTGGLRVVNPFSK